LIKGRPASALVDLSGGVAETYLLQEDPLPANFLEKFQRRLDDEKVRNLACVSAWMEGGGESVKLGLVQKHAYTIVKIVNVKVDEDNSVDLVQLRNPWGTGFEWSGPWGDASKLWEKVSQEEKERIGYVKKADGEFFMAWDTMVKRMSVLTEVQIDKADMEMVTFNGEWVRDTTAGGANIERVSFAANPQFLIDLADADDDDVMASAVISLTQHNKKEDDVAIGFSLYRWEQSAGRMGLAHLRSFKPVVQKCEYVRDITKRITVEPGKYMIVPYTFETNQENSFTLRLFSEKRSLVAIVVKEAKKGEFQFGDRSNNMEKPVKRESVELFGMAAIAGISAIGSLTGLF